MSTQKSPLVLLTPSQQVEELTGLSKPPPYTGEEPAPRVIVVREKWYIFGLALTSTAPRGRLQNL